MKQTAKKTKHVATRTVWLSVLGSIVLGVAILLVGLSIYGNSLIQESISRTRATASRAQSSARRGADTAGLARDVMQVYQSLTPDQRSMTGTEEYRQFFRGLDSVSAEWEAHDVLINLLRNFLGDVSRIYICAFDTERNVMVYLADSDRDNPHYPGEWEAVPDGWIEKLTDFTEYEWNVDNTPYDIWRTEDGGKKCVTAYALRDEAGQTYAFLVAELSINSVYTEIIQYALKVSAVALALTLLIAYLVGMRMKKTVADPINAIANAAISYVQDRKNGNDRSDHFSSLGIRTEDELENLTNIMADMERELSEHEDQIETLLDSLVKALSTAIDD